jgi:ABC-type polysaccharide/polyol phosphate export permease
MRSLARLNPLAQVVDAYRRAILAGRLPAAEDFALLAGISGVTFVLGGLFFRRTKRAFGDVL